MIRQEAEETPVADSGSDLKMAPNCGCGRKEATLHYKGVLGGIWVEWGGCSFPGAGQGGLKEAIKGPRNGITNVSLPLKKRWEKTSALHFSLPCRSFVCQTIWESASLSRALVFSRGAAGSFRQARRVRRTNVRSQSGSVRVSRKNKKNKRVAKAAAAAAAECCRLFSPVYHL